VKKAEDASGSEEVHVFADGDEEAVQAFCALAETKHPARSDVSNIVFDDFEGEVVNYHALKIWEKEKSRPPPFQDL
jgi:hypothetical protein